MSLSCHPAQHYGFTLSDIAVLSAAFGRRNYHAAYDMYTRMLEAGADPEALISRSLVASKLGGSHGTGSTSQPLQLDKLLGGLSCSCIAQASMRLH